MVPYPTQRHPPPKQSAYVYGTCLTICGTIRLPWAFLKDLTQERRSPSVFLSLKGCFLLLCPSGFHPGKAWGGPDSAVRIQSHLGRQSQSRSRVDRVTCGSAIGCMCRCTETCSRSQDWIRRGQRQGQRTGVPCPFPIWPYPHSL